jgi:hypothetical protein
MTSTLKSLGKIVLLQIQTAALKVADQPEQRYDPVALLSVPDLTLTVSGAQTMLPNGEVILDIHNADHPQSKNSKGKNDLSIGFTSHYTEMRERYGEHLSDGIAGESILVAIDRRVTLGELQNGIAIQTGNGLVKLQNLRIALPCSPFSKFASRSTEPEVVKAALQFLDGGTRGFYCAYEGEGSVTVAVGDEVLILP